MSENYVHVMEHVVVSALLVVVFLLASSPRRRSTLVDDRELRSQVEALEDDLREWKTLAYRLQSAVVQLGECFERAGIDLEKSQHTQARID